MVRNYKRKTVDRWSKEDLLEALISIKESKLKINDAARQFGISRATLYRQYTKFINRGGKLDIYQFKTCGGNPILTNVEEDVLEKTIMDLRNQGFTVTSSDIKRICFEYCDSNSIPNQFNPSSKRMASDDWYYGFLKRHPVVRTGGFGRAFDFSPEIKRRKIKKEVIDPEEMPEGTINKKKKLKGRRPTRFNRRIKSPKRGTPEATLTIVPAGDDIAFDENCEGQEILGDIVNGEEPDRDTECQSMQNDENETNDAGEDHTEEMPELTEDGNMNQSEEVSNDAQ